MGHGWRHPYGVHPSYMEPCIGCSLDRLGTGGPMGPTPVRRSQLSQHQKQKENGDASRTERKKKKRDRENGRWNLVQWLKTLRPPKDSSRVDNAQPRWEKGRRKGEGIGEERNQFEGENE
ncbi:hypothetical protein Sjap_011288 [Stephania japonica]|uniref:Uncharacterized protein n=1 Tax=Stephania japonica TaxID=461633 RepID=A0AAP0JD13_9MAGN